MKMDNWTVQIVFGTEDARKAGEGRWEELENRVCEYAFSTAAELEAFLEGVDAAVGWLDSYQLSDDEWEKYKKARPLHGKTH